MVNRTPRRYKMADTGQIPTFITGANARIKIGAITMAYCTDVSYTINVATIPVEAMGKYEPYSNEPIAYSVDGTFSVIRYIAKTDAAKTILNTSAEGDGVTPLGIDSHFNPASILASSTFTLEIHQALSTAGVAATEYKNVFKITDCRMVRRGATLNKRGVMVDNYAFVGILATDTDMTDASKQTGPSGVTGSSVV